MSPSPSLITASPTSGHVPLTHRAVASLDRDAGQVVCVDDREHVLDRVPDVGGVEVAPASDVVALVVRE